LSTGVFDGVAVNERDTEIVRDDVGLSDFVRVIVAVFETVRVFEMDDDAE
jgi:hypothetical protein